MNITRRQFLKASITLAGGACVALPFVDAEAVTGPSSYANSAPRIALPVTHHLDGRSVVSRWETNRADWSLSFFHGRLAIDYTKRITIEAVDACTVGPGWIEDLDGLVLHRFQSMRTFHLMACDTLQLSVIHLDVQP